MSALLTGWRSIEYIATRLDTTLKIVKDKRICADIVSERRSNYARARGETARPGGRNGRAVRGDAPSCARLVEAAKGTNMF